MDDFGESKMKHILVISIDELWLKGKNRQQYTRSGIEHINAVLKAHHKEKFTYKVQSERLHYTSNVFFSEETVDALTKVPGLAYVSR